ncbi:putative threonine efflux protein [Desulfosporosinus acidiphilus SJ4]|uniref:Putative threonine efflux protein n=1 Tax=Desulfosporosinus acidiphilus (strain DSM 22704 / JCM 16185 / SJ4) TaxID=646529 RepID=I4D5M9_DESAJ|nr:LysE family translocator [Desulfosporosinus acidiphilus]AFM41103.1 putative threonine efflux protein [Desulfosporosinus acidiphilus SJ4]
MSIYTFIVTSLIIILLPGTGVIYTISTGITKGKKASAIAALGCTAGILPHLMISIGFSSVLLRMSEQAFFVLKMAGVLYLFYLGVRMLLSKTKLDLGETIKEENPGTVIRRAILINLLNPKLTLFFFSFLPQYLSRNSQSYIRESFLLGIVFMLLTFIVFAGYGILAGSVKTIVAKSPKRLQGISQVFGIIFIVFAINLAASSL